VNKTQYFTLLKLAEYGAAKKTIKISTNYLAEKLGASQQTVSRHLIELEKEGLISRTVTHDGCIIRIIESGIIELRKIYSLLRSIFEADYPPSVILEGTLFSGIGEGGYYIKHEKYRVQFIEKLGFDPYPGTLNLKLLTDHDKMIRQELDEYPSIYVSGFEDESRTYGPVRCYKIIINNKAEGAIVIAGRTHYDKSVLEIISPEYLRDHLNLKDGSKVKVELYFTKET
jgi:riboflavin kinase